MRLLDAIKTRTSIRAYLSTPVPRQVIADLLDSARWAPSGSNRQPWRVSVVTGAALRSWQDELAQRLSARPWDGERRRAFDDRVRDGSLGGLTALTAMSPFELLVVGSNRLYDAPAALVLSFEGSPGDHPPDAIAAFATTFMLAAHDHGLGTCWLGFALAQHDLVRQYACVPENEQPAAVIALGYPDPEAAINTFRSTRLEPEAFCRWIE